MLVASSSCANTTVPLQLIVNPYLIELKPRADKMWLDKPGFIDGAWKFFEDSTMSIEILKDAQLQKAYFNVRDKVCVTLP